MTAPSRMTRTRSDSPSTSGTSLETSRTPTPVVGERADQRVDLRPGPDVDAAGRLVEQQQPGSRRAASGRGRPSAGCRRTACAPCAVGSAGRTSQRLDRLARRRVARAPRFIQPQPREPRQASRARRCARPARRAAAPGSCAPPGPGRARAHGGVDAPRRQLAAVDGDRAGRTPAGAVDGLEDLGAARRRPARRCRRSRPARTVKRDVA